MQQYENVVYTSFYWKLKLVYGENGKLFPERSIANSICRMLKVSSSRNKVIARTFTSLSHFYFTSTIHISPYFKIVVEKVFNAWILECVCVLANFYLSSVCLISFIFFSACLLLSVKWSEIINVLNHNESNIRA